MFAIYRPGYTPKEVNETRNKKLKNTTLVVMWCCFSQEFKNKYN